MPIPYASSMIADMSADLATSWQLGVPGRLPVSEVEEEGCLEVASAAKLLFPGRCCICKRH